eukprot:CAMPEP_0206188694 /NCGR_PEP_ID=MMETSP0166-20121206/3724_1 /ASSEMBLY_ACC=CAM_ASM_000260 /TAXON_ID=95228 /ORGANISM="Vannella robusta, Strain DIVA3 518/3/11/1/6" /LENGTH=126 /DNA_ID=CAMNT_0053604465 /DNA_START=487 /DNA_END=867 /DNA_ORIENTATION=-
MTFCLKIKLEPNTQNISYKKKNVSITTAIFKFVTRSTDNANATIDRENISKITQWSNTKYNTPKVIGIGATRNNSSGILPIKRRRVIFVGNLGNRTRITLIKYVANGHWIKATENKEQPTSIMSNR